ncbi:unnamed protein product [Vitrella brassicaformis CCMP3155]|uniref:Carotenoid oxygenase n=2 Tax=Vitrella brassicaformis TaxID=1169539 RepID=A0A0G4ER58_VITBC|nr:unnamed protein product [Vitrella brassicaformis CCMP3155]|eukprot:CEM00728.1 unnamed protein product [Vitrella brassicaformis CCMP3155]
MSGAPTAISEPPPTAIEPRRESRHDPSLCDVDAFKRNFMEPPEGYYYLEGDIPSDLEGTFFKNIPAKFEIGGEKITHPFDAHGMIAAVTFQDSTAFFRNKFIRSPYYLRELRANRILYRGVGTQKKGGWIRNVFDTFLRNVANTHVVYWSGFLLALWEGAAPWNMDPIALGCWGATDLRKSLENTRDPFSAHYKIDPIRNRLVNFGTKIGLNSGKVTAWEYDDQFDCVSRKSFNVQGTPFMHDWALTDNYYVWFQNPTSFNPFAFLLGTKTAFECIDFDKTKPAVVHLLPRDSNMKDGEGLISVPIDSFFNFHFVNSYEDKATGEVVVDVVTIDNYDKFDIDDDIPLYEAEDLFANVSKSLMYRYRLNTRDGTFRKEPLVTDRSLDFPTVNPRVVTQKHRYVWFCAQSEVGPSGPVQAPVKLDVETNERQIWLPEPHEFVGEMVFAPKKAKPPYPDTPEDEGYLLAYLFNGRDMKSELLIFEARDISQGPIRRLPLQYALPLGLHGQFAPDAVFDKKRLEKQVDVAMLWLDKGWGRKSEAGFSIIDPAIL